MGSSTTLVLAAPSPTEERIVPHVCVLSQERRRALEALEVRLAQERLCELGYLRSPVNGERSEAYEEALEQALVGGPGSVKASNREGE